MIYIVIIALVWIAGIYPAYQKIKEWDNNQFEKYAFSLIWPLVVPLYYIWKLHNKL